MTASSPVQSLTGAGTSYLDFIELTLGSNNQSSELSGVVTGTGSLVKAGSGTLTLSGANSYAGGTTVTGGTLQLGTLASTGSIIGTVDVRAGTTLNLINTDGNGMAVTAEAGGTVDFSNSAGPAGDYKQTIGSIAGAGSYLLGANELTVGSKNQSTEVSGVISGTGGSLVKIGDGTMTLSAANTYTGGTTVNGGTLQLGTLARTGSVVGAISVGAGGTLSIVNTGWRFPAFRTPVSRPTAMECRPVTPRSPTAAHSSSPIRQRPAAPSSPPPVP